MKAELSGQVVAHVARLGPGWLVSARRSRLVVLLTSGLDALDEYFARYLPQLVATLIAPVVVVVAIAVVDPLSAVVIAVTVPLIPLFMVLIGWRTQVEQRRQWEALQTLSGHFLDVLHGLVTLKIFGRSQGQARGIGEVSERYRERTMKVLRISFLSSFTLELLATLSVAVVAVEVGLRLVEGGMDLRRPCSSSSLRRRHTCRCVRSVCTSTPARPDWPRRRRSSRFSRRLPLRRRTTRST